MNKKTIWITGGSTGIGKALAIKFANEGWNVAISARREQLLEEISNEYENISSFPLDVTNKSNCNEVFNQIINKFQNIDICFFSTGTWDPKREKDIDKTIQKNEVVLPDYTNGPVQTNTGWCFIGAEEGARKCVKMNGNICMSNQIFDSKQKCVDNNK